MSDHYYAEHPQSKAITETKQVSLLDQSFVFKMSSGVFSKKGIDFGTRLLIESFEVPKVEGDILDLGCGYGPIGVALAYQNPDRNIYMIDINERAISLAKENARLNNVTNVIVKQSDGFLNVDKQLFAAIVTNPPIRAGKKVIYNFFKTSLSFLKPNGELWVVIQKKQGAPSTIEYLTAIYDEVETVVRKKGYYIIRARRGSG
ncbi:class I SAM-dependent methyltransferase [Pseudogracilibacillus sp. SO30301A]|uniref:class I SAM-dependent methyltransferase n=1 Tax=Pseudogracilibacillus sp. SO30301A TaxID=3098291 RepID=UPI00300DCFD0